MHKLCTLPLIVAGVMLALMAGVAAQDYPTKPVRLIVPFPPGGSNDIVGRAIATQLAARLGRPFVVENRAGAGGVVGTEIVANAPKDGHTLLMVSIAHTVNPWLYKLPYDTIQSFAPVAILASGPNVLAVHPDLPVNSVKELVELAKKKPGQIQWASGGVGGFQHLAGELFRLETGVNMLHVPFKGAAPAMIDVIGGHTKVVFSALVAAVPHIRSGKLKALGTGGRERNAILPEIPTIAEAGVPGYEAINWWGIAAPNGTPARIVEKLHDAIAAAQNAPELQKQFASEGSDIVRMSSADFGSFMNKEMRKWERVVKEGGIKPE
jgi:tripartite-type tricarboxylate transporter receptor subunit TctC